MMSPSSFRMPIMQQSSMVPCPYRPAAELDGTLERGELSFAVTLAAEVSQERHRPIDLIRSKRSRSRS